MAEPTAPLIDRPTETEVYRPLSGLAVAAFGLAALYAVVLGVVGITCLVSRTPPFLSPWTLLVPATAAVLGVAARQHLRYAEGTRSGEGLVTWAFRLSALGLVYLAIYLATFLAVKMQAEKFSREWFEKIRDGKLNAAFLDTRKPEERENDDPNDEGRLYIRYGSSGSRRGELPQFIDSEFVQLLTTPDATVEDQGVRDLEYDQGGYKVELSYRITTPEVEYDWIVTARSALNSKKQREWLVAPPRPAERPRFTPLGQARMQMKDEALRLIHHVANQRSQGDLTTLYLQSCEPAKRKDLEALMRARVAGAVALQMANAQHGALPVIVGQQSTRVAEQAPLPGFEEFTKRSIAVVDPARDAPQRTPAMNDLAAGFCQPDQDIRLRVNEEGRFYFRADPKDPNRVHCEKDVEVMVFEKGAPAGAPKVIADARFVVEGIAGESGKKTQFRIVRLAVMREKAGAPPGPTRPR